MGTILKVVLHRMKRMEVRRKVEIRQDHNLGLCLCVLLSHIVVFTSRGVVCGGAMTAAIVVHSMSRRRQGRHMGSRHHQAMSRLIGGLLNGRFPPPHRTIRIVHGLTLFG